MNEVLAISSFVLGSATILLFAYFGRTFLFAFSAFIIVATNATVGIQVELFGFSVSWGVILYSLVYLITDMLSEFYEKNAAYKLALSNLAIQVAFWAYIFLTLPVDNVATTSLFSALEELYAVTPRITIAAIVAALGAFVDIWVYEKIRSWAMQKRSVFADLWFRNNVSTFLGQSVNTVLFFGIALWGVVPNIWEIIGGAIAFKWAIAVADTPILYMARGLFMKGAVPATDRDKP